jgi:DNA-binding response OmpR family regulator
VNEAAQNSFPEWAGGRRRALVVAAAAHAPLEECLVAAGYEIQSATADAALRLAADAAPDVILVVLNDADDEGSEPVALARRLRADARTFSLPLVVLYRRDEDALRLAALGVGADDYFELATPPAEVRARLDSLLWRAEAGRLATLSAGGEDVAPAGEQGAEEVAERAGGVGTVSEAPPPLHSEHAPAEAASASATVTRESGDGGGGARVGEDDTTPSADGAAAVSHAPRASVSPAAAREARMIEALGAASQSLAGAGRGTSQRGPASAGARPARGGPRRLLLAVSDSARMAQLNLLIRSANYEVRTAFDGQHALNLLRIERPDLVLVDSELRDMGGVEMLRRLREQQGGGRAAPTPAILLLAAPDEGARREAEEIGARAVVTLPYNSEELLESIKVAGSAE